MSARDYARRRRAANTAAGLCLNNAKHGKATHGVRCKRCHETHRRSR